MTRIGIGLLLVNAVWGQETFHISGIVVNSQTGQPVKSALVRVNGGMRVVAGGAKTESSQELLTDSSGRFSASGMSAGAFYLTAEKNGFEPNSAKGGANMTVGPSRDDVSISLSPLAIITGQITDGEGEPVVSAAVRAISVTLQDGVRVYRQSRAVTTDDQGRYRMWNFTPGEYYIATVGRSGGTIAAVGATLVAGAGGPEAFAPVYFPSAGDRATATPIVLSPGQEFTANLRVRMEPSFRVRGTLNGATPYQPLQVELMRGPNDLNATRALVNSVTGRFEVREVVAGTYMVRATQTSGKVKITGERQVQVTRADVSGIVMDLAPGVMVKGEVRMPAPANAPARLPLGRFRSSAQVALTPVGTDFATVLRTSADEQGQFSIENVPPGRYRVSVIAYSGYAAAAISGTQDLLRGELMVGVAPPPRIEIDVRNDGGTISLTTKETEGAVLLIPTAGGEVSTTGAFPGAEIANLAPGDYRAIWVKSLDNLEYRNPEVVRALRGGETVRVDAGARVTVNLKEMVQ